MRMRWDFSLFTEFNPSVQVGVKTASILRFFFLLNGTHLCDCGALFSNVLQTTYNLITLCT